ncbi:MAG: TonB-dependent receptor [Pseudomonas sp.]
MKHHPNVSTLARALGIALLAGASGGALAQQATSGEQEQTPATPSPPQGVVELDKVQVSGYRRSIQFSTDAKRDSVTFSDTVFAEDIGKFPDMNIAESLNRVPGVQLSRDVTGEGLNVSVRGLGTSFTKTTLNGASIATASIGINAQNQNREVDLNLFPTEFFTQLSVSKTPTASMLEGGISGVVDMRSARPFDRPGTHFTYQAQESWNSDSGKYSPNGSFMGSWTNDAGTFGILAGVSSVRNNILVDGFESVGWTNPGLTYSQCGLTPPDGTSATAVAADCNASGGGNWIIPATVPSTASGLTAGETIDAAWLLAHNPGLSIEQISEALIPRLGRQVYMDGERDRNAAVVSMEWRPSDRAHFYLDTMFSRAHRTTDRIDMNLVGRSGSMIPLDMQLDANNVVTSATFANAQFMLEARRYVEDVKFWSINPGGEIFFGDDDWIKLDVQANASRSWMLRRTASVLLTSPYTTIDYSNSGGDYPTWTTGGLDLNDPDAGWSWYRLNIQNEKRVTWTRGARADLQFGHDERNVKIGAAYDEAFRSIVAFDNSTAWQNSVYATIADSDIASYLTSTGHGFISVDFDNLFAATNYYALSESAPEAGSAMTGASTGSIQEKNLGFYVETNGQFQLWDRTLRYNAGARYVTTDQTIAGPVTVSTGSYWVYKGQDYSKILPSFNLAWDVADRVVMRLSASRSMTRPNPSSMLPNTNFSDPSAQTATQGNSSLAPYYSTNVDFGGEWYTGGEGFVGLTLFNKRIKGFTVNATRTIPFSELGISYSDLTETQQAAIDQRGGADQATVDVTTQVNADGLLDIRGVEAIWVQPLDRLLDGLGFSLNYTHVKQKSEGGGVAAVAEGVAPNLWNSTVYWEKGPVSLRASYTWNDKMVISSANQNGITAARLFSDARGQVDLSASYTLKHVWSSPQITLNVTNLTNEPLRTTFAYDNATYDFYLPGRTIMLGVRGSF